MKLEKLLVLSGDGIGPSVTKSAEDIIRATTDSLEIVHGEIGRSAYESTGSYLPHDTMDLLDDCKVILSGPINIPENVKNPLDILKVQLDLYSRGRFYKTLSNDLGVKDMAVTLWSSYNNISNEITEVKDFDGVTISKYIKSNAYSRMMTVALSDVEIRGLKKIACLSREDFFPISSGMFIDAFDSLFTDSEMITEHYNVKDWMSVVFKDPLHNDCIVCVDLYNQIVAGVLSGMTGNENLYPTVYKGSDYSIYEPYFYHEIEGFEEGYANPTSSIIACSIIMENLGLKKEGDNVMKALCEAYQSKERTPDVGGTLTTEEFTNKVISHLD